MTKAKRKKLTVEIGFYGILWCPVVRTLCFIAKGTGQENKQKQYRNNKKIGPICNTDIVVNKNKILK